MNIAIIGAGSIGALKDNKFDSPFSEFILTHAHALYTLRKKKIIKDFYIIDTDLNKLKKACLKWSFKGSSDIKNIKEKLDIIIVAVDTDNHFFIMKEILELKNLPRLVICEKPFCSNDEQAMDIHRLYKEKNIPIVINYTRRFCTQIQSLQRKIEGGELGKVKSCNIIYVRGFKRDACHAIDLCHFFFGRFIRGKILGDDINAFNDYSDKDLTMPVWMEFEHCKNIFLTPADGRNYSIFEMDILTEFARISLIDHTQKTKIYLRKSEEIYGDFFSINYEADIILQNDLQSALYFLHGNCIEYLNSKKNMDLFSTSITALDTQITMSKLLRNYK